MSQKGNKDNVKLTEQEKVRRQKMQDLIDMGVESIRPGLSKNPPNQRYSAGLCGINPKKNSKNFRFRLKSPAAL